MAKDKKSFILYCDLLPLVEQLTDEQTGKLFKHILMYVNDKDPVTDDILLKIAFEPIKQQLKRDLKRYETILQKRIEAGKISAEGRKQLKEQNEHMLTHVNDAEQNEHMSTDNDTVNVTVTDNVNVNVKSYKNILLSEIKISDFPHLNPKHYEIAYKFQQLIKKNIIESGAKPVHIDKTKGDAIDCIRLLIENDKYTIEDLVAVYQFLPKSEFWRKNILSIGKVREKFDKLIIAAKTETNGKELENEHVYKGKF